MGQGARVVLLLMAVPLLGGAVSPGRAPPELSAQGWRKGEWHGIAPAGFAATPAGGIRVTGRGQGSFLWRPLSGAPACLTWRWRVAEGPPPTDLARRGGDDRALSVTVGFAGFGPEAGFATRARHAAAQAGAGDMSLARSMLGYVWGGTGREGQGGFFESPWTPGITRLRVLRPADAPRGRWFEERVDLAADWRAAFGNAEPPPLLKVVIATDAEDSGAAVDAELEGLRFGPCR